MQENNLKSGIEREDMYMGGRLPRTLKGQIFKCATMEYL